LQPLNCQKPFIFVKYIVCLLKPLHYVAARENTFIRFRVKITGWKTTLKTSRIFKVMKATSWSWKNRDYEIKAKRSVYIGKMLAHYTYCVLVALSSTSPIPPL